LAGWALLESTAATSVGAAFAAFTRPALIAFRALAPLLLRETTPLLVARHLETLARIFVLTSGAPRWPALFPCRALALQRLERLLRRFPQTPARKPHHPRVRMPRLQLAQRRRKLLLCSRAKRCRLILENDRPVGEARRHESYCVGVSRFSFSISVVRLRFRSFAA
jgi:hypothetical protein